MILFSKKSLCYNDYNWTAYSQSDPHISGKLDTTRFNKSEGNEVVFLVNKLMAMWDYRFISSGNKMEKLIHDELPGEADTQEAVQQWLKEHLK